jgi:hypothetical protein
LANTQRPAKSRTSRLILLLMKNSRKSSENCFRRSDELRFRPSGLTPNPSVKRTANGVPPSPRHSAVLLLLRRGPGAIPPAAAYLKR